MKRSRSVRLMLIGAAAFTVAGCQDDKIEAHTFKDKEACVRQSQGDISEFSAEDCEKAFAEAEREHLRTAPRYDEASLCSSEHGGTCEFVEPTSGGGGGFFMPFMAGYLLGDMMDRNKGGRSHYRAQPLYKTSSGSFATAAGTSVGKRLSGTTSLRPAAFNRAPSVKAPMTKATIASRGGFGASRTAISSSGSRSFGG